MKNPSQPFLPPRLRLFVLLAILMFVKSAQADNVIQLENAKLGTEAWKLTNPATAREIEGYASLTSVNRGGQINLFVSTYDSSYTIDIFRMGSYAGLGARRVLGPVIRNGFHQNTPSPNADGLIDCNWSEPYVLTIPNSSDATDWASGIYLAKLTAGGGKQSYITFVVRDDARPSFYLFQSSVTTFQAYNYWGGVSLYNWEPPNAVRNHGVKISFNRPYAWSGSLGSVSGIGAGEFLTNFQPGYETYPAGWEYNMVRWLEREGYDVSYCTDVDTHVNASLLTTSLHKAFLSVGHDEYWSRQMRTNVEGARDQGLSLGFFSANTCFWQIRFEPSPVTGASNRTIVCYKDDYISEDPHASDNLATKKWRDLGLAEDWEDAMLGVAYQYDPVDVDLVLLDASSWVCANTGLNNGDHLTGLVGYEIDSIYGHAPAALGHIGMSPFVKTNGETKWADMTVYTVSSGATVFATGSIQWSWGLDNYNAPALRPARLNFQAQQMTRNVLSRFANESSTFRPNPIDDARFFVRAQYHDFLNREPDQNGWDYWTGQITQCGSDAPCLQTKRDGVSAAFFVEQEFQTTGAYVYRIYKASLAHRPTYAQFIADRSLIVPGGDLDASKQAFADAFVQRSEFLQTYPVSLSGTEFIDSLLQTVLQTSNADLGSQRDALIADYNTYNSRGRIVRLVAENGIFQEAEYNRSFVLMQYFGYLRRPPDSQGYDFWVNALNSDPGNSIGMVDAFISSAEYRLRFGQL